MRDWDRLAPGEKAAACLLAAIWRGYRRDPKIQQASHLNAAIAHAFPGEREKIMHWFTSKPV
jgi:hypothetical protein